MSELPTRIFIVDDQPPFRSVARTVVRLAFGIEDITDLESGEAAVEQALAEPPSLILMDINLGGITGIEATRRIIDAHPDTVVVLLSTYDVDSLPTDASTCGAARYVHKEDLSPAILHEIWAEATSG